MARSLRAVGDENRNGLSLLAKTTIPGNDHNQVVWVVRCKRNHIFGVNGSDFHHRHCPECQPQYAKGLSVPAAILSEIKVMRLAPGDEPADFGQDAGKDT